MPERAIRALSWGAGRIANQYVAHLQIACLEMEKARKGREKASTLRRVETLDGHLRDIEAEKAAVLRALAERGAASAAGAPSGGSNPTAPRSGRGFDPDSALSRQGADGSGRAETIQVAYQTDGTRSRARPQSRGKNLAAGLRFKLRY